MIPNIRCIYIYVIFVYIYIHMLYHVIIYIYEYGWQYLPETPKHVEGSNTLKTPMGSQQNIFAEKTDGTPMDQNESLGGQGV